MVGVAERGIEIQMSGTYPTSDAAEADAFEFCTETLNGTPDRVSRL